LIQSWLVHANVFAALTHRALGASVPLAWNGRQSLDALDREKWLTRKLISASPMLARVPAAIVYNSLHSAGQHEALGFPADRSVLIPNGFDIEEFAPRGDLRRSVRSELGVDRDALLIGLIGRFHPVKNHAGFFEAAADVLKSEPRARFLLAGAGTNANRMGPLLQSPALRERFISLGARPDIVRITCALDIACNVSHSEAFPNAVSEAMACGVPCVVTPVGESRQIVGDTGMIAEDTKGSSIAAALLRLIALGPEARVELGRRARERIVDNYSLDRAARSFEQLYETLIGRSPESSLRRHA
jgi:glycosyltransferase involved in cell wall biosynthesis